MTINKNFINRHSIPTPLFITILILLLLVLATKITQAQISVSSQNLSSSFTLVGKGKVTAIYFDTADATVVEIAARTLKNDVELVSGKALTIDSTSPIKSSTIIIGTIGKSRLIDQLIKIKKLNVSSIKGTWETFSINVINNPLPNVTNALVIAGSDARGTAYGVFELSKAIGVSPFYWWADAQPKHLNEIYIKGSVTSKPPSVKYRGIFLNDEDWGLQPWAAKTFEPETGDIGPKTYSKIFELLLRLKANLIWPAMHPSTKAFYSYPGNKKVAADYSIVVGSSHAEPMLRNNVGEWDTKTMGEFNYLTNKERVYKYWEDRVKESSTNDAIYSLGMRGVHDSGIEGVKTAKEAVPLLERIFADQRGMLTKYINKDITAIPQAFTAYKEVLEIYDSNLKLPDDVTLVWPDDNYGYIQRLNNEKEKDRAGGSGVYYHASYWGRPHDYLWLSTTHPALIREEMMKAYENKSNGLWVLNVGDIKPLEYNIQMFLDMAYDATPFKSSAYSKVHLNNWAASLFGQDKAAEVSSILWKYYQLAFERRPEFMGWSQTEPTTKTNYTQYNHINYGDEAQQRIDVYDSMERQVKDLRTRIAAKDKDAFFELVYYPVIGASLMNKKVLYRDKSYLYSRQNRLSAFDYANQSKQAFNGIEKETNFYNNDLANGKWKNIMSMKPRDLPVYQEPVIREIKIDRTSIWNIAPEGLDTTQTSNPLLLPDFDIANNQKYFIDIFLSDNKQVKWSCETTADWIKMSKVSGVLNAVGGKKEERIWVSIDWRKVPLNNVINGTIVFKGLDKQIPVKVTANNQLKEQVRNFKGFIENYGYVSIYAKNFSKNTTGTIGRWQVIEGLGYTGASIEAVANVDSFKVDTANLNSIKETLPFVEYDIYTFNPADAIINIYSLPTHPLNNNYSMRYGVSIDNQTLKIVNFRTIGRSEEWKQNVLRNNAIKKVEYLSLPKGKHSLKIYMLDPGVIIDRITIDLGNLKTAYDVIPETRISN